MRVCVGQGASGSPEGATRPTAHLSPPNRDMSIEGMDGEGAGPYHFPPNKEDGMTFVASKRGETAEAFLKRVRGTSKDGDAKKGDAKPKDDK